MIQGISRTAMVLAAGLGKRMRPITETMPKPLVPVAGKPLIDWGLDALDTVGIETAVVNVHYLADQMISYLAQRVRPRILISDERDQLLDSAGGIVKALTLLEAEPFFVINADTFWIDRATPNLERLALAWDDRELDILLMLSDFESATGHGDKADFVMHGNGRLRRAKPGEAGFIYAGAAIVHPRIFTGTEARPHSLNLYFDRAIEAGRLYGLPLDGSWITVGTPDAIGAAEAVVNRLRSTA
ncbi:MurNAc alpha-1-phosphate uridylyltransferase [Mesorhizobium sp. J18]|uniref:nucleotidyltransferase family protein n=1 Tax=Mesorhizobium sp. J18 TaxID=935263 RepID=UPI00119AB956|nr:nucleotidyltransferase family protein [Mesorhizobium sp. J18]TWG88951.1 MurNAc alpha-1-phosphate uridylyltransferase [Mesorhizobium sp. J18]